MIFKSNGAIIGVLQLFNHKGVHVELYALGKMLCKEYNAHVFAVLLAALVVYFLVLLKIQKIFYEIKLDQKERQADNEVRFMGIEKDIESHEETLKDHGARIFHLEDKYRSRKNGKREKRSSASA